MTRYTEVEVLFGSSSRGDVDSLSDRDILIIDNDLHALNQRRMEIESEGGSVASYTWKRLQSLIEKGSLFIQHLKLESKIIEDRDGHFKAALEAYQPKNSYKKELDDNTSLLNITTTYPNTTRGALWAADMLYVAIRNYGVLRLAENKKYLFSYSAIIGALCEEKIISPQYGEDLLKLRHLKSIYRQSSATYIFPIEKTLSNVCRALTQTGVPLRCCATTAPEILQTAVPIGPEGAIYGRLRNLEKIYIALTELDPSLEFDKDFAQLKRWIEDPRSYGFLAAKNENKLFSRIYEESAHLLERKIQTHSINHR